MPRYELWVLDESGWSQVWVTDQQWAAQHQADRWPPGWAEVIDRTTGAVVYRVSRP